MQRRDKVVVPFPRLVVGQVALLDGVLDGLQRDASLALSVGRGGDGGYLQCVEGDPRVFIGDQNQAEQGVLVQLHVHLAQSVQFVLDGPHDDNLELVLG
ncbi:hypothetical protein ES703_66382 [subsurface metagenome]